MGKNLVDGCKVKGVIYWVFVEKGVFVEFCFYECLFIVFNLGVVDNFVEIINLEFLVKV